MILVDNELHVLGPQLLDPWDPGMVQPASIDLRLGTTFRVFRRRTLTSIDLATVPDPDVVSELVEVPLYVDRDGNPPNPAGRFVIHPGELVLGATLECITVPVTLGMQLTGKSTLARLGLLPHVEAGWFDPGWHGIGTLEIANLGAVPITLRPGLKICQSKWMQLSSLPNHAYGSAAAGSHYQGGDMATGAATDWNTPRR